jgi:hypothetical protein
VCITINDATKHETFQQPKLLSWTSVPFWQEDKLKQPQHRVQCHPIPALNMGKWIITIVTASYFNLLLSVDQASLSTT